MNPDGAGRPEMTVGTLYVCSPGCGAIIRDDEDAFERHLDTCLARAGIVTLLGRRALDLIAEHDCDAYDCDMLEGPCVVTLLSAAAHGYRADVVAGEVVAQPKGIAP